MHQVAFRFVQRLNTLLKVRRLKIYVFSPGNSTLLKFPRSAYVQHLYFLICDQLLRLLSIDVLYLQFRVVRRDRFRSHYRRSQ